MATKAKKILNPYSYYNKWCKPIPKKVIWTGLQEGCSLALYCNQHWSEILATVILLDSGDGDLKVRQEASLVYKYNTDTSNRDDLNGVDYYLVKEDYKKDWSTRYIIE